MCVLFDVGATKVCVRRCMMCSEAIYGSLMFYVILNDGVCLVRSVLVLNPPPLVPRTRLSCQISQYLFVSLLFYGNAMPIRSAKESQQTNVHLHIANDIHARMT